MLMVGIAMIAVILIVLWTQFSASPNAYPTFNVTGTNTCSAESSITSNSTTTIICKAVGK
jgi:hypothetical protein